MGWKVKGDFEDQFEEFVWETGIDEISPVITTRYGYHLIVVVDRVLTAADAYERRLHEEVTTEEEPDAGKDATPDPA